MINYYQTIPELGIKGRFNTPEEFKRIGLPKDLTGKSVLDIGCNIGAFLFEAYKRGARVLSGVEPNNDWRWICQGIAEDLNINVAIGETIEDVLEPHDLVLLLSVTHVVEGMTGQEILDKAWSLVEKGGLLIVEINDRLQKEKLILPKGAVFYGQNKDNRSCYKVFKDDSNT